MKNIGTVQDTDGKVWNIQLAEQGDEIPESTLESIAEQHEAERELREEMKTLAEEWN